MASIIIPAHNEETVIVNSLTPLIKNGIPSGFQIIVVCNGCNDNTASIVKNLHPEIECLETKIASKINALNIGDSFAKYYPRIYLDADISINYEALKEIILTLQSTNFLATSVEAKMDMKKSSWIVRSFYDIWLNLPYCKAGMIGSGVYALSEQGRARFDKFPNIIADDGYIRALFKENERTVTKGQYATVTAPCDLFSLIKIKTRSRLGRYQLKKRFPKLLENETKDFQGAFRILFFDFKLWPKTFIYLSVNFISRIRAKQQYLTKQTTWERDESSRS